MRVSQTGSQGLHSLTWRLGGGSARAFVFSCWRCPGDIHHPIRIISSKSQPTFYPRVHNFFASTPSFHGHFSFPGPKNSLYVLLSTSQPYCMRPARVMALDDAQTQHVYIDRHQRRSYLQQHLLLQLKLPGLQVAGQGCAGRGQERNRLGA